MAAASGATYTEVLARSNMTNNDLSLIGYADRVVYAIASVSFQNGQLVKMAKSEMVPNNTGGSFGGYSKLVYMDDTEYSISLPAALSGYTMITNPHPEKLVKRIETQRMGPGGPFNPDINCSRLYVYTTNLSSITFTTPVAATRIYPSIQAVDCAEVTERSVVLRLSNSTLIVTDWNQWVDIPAGFSVVSIEVRGKIGNLLQPKINGLKILQL